MDSTAVVSMMNTSTSSLIFIILAVMYFLPSLCALSQKHKNKSAIFLLNFFTGWTFIGWVISIVWAYKK